MNNIIKRNKTMFMLSLAAVVGYLLRVILNIIGFVLFNEFEDFLKFQEAISILMSLFLFVGYIAVYVHWTPDKLDTERKRPKWQFVLLLVSILLPMIQNILYNFAGFEWGTTWVRIPSSSIMLYITQLLLPLKWAMIVILLIKCERKAKKIMIMYLISEFLSILMMVVNILLVWMDCSLDEYLLFSHITSFFSFANNILLLVFTAVYTKYKYNEAKQDLYALPEIDPAKTE